MKKSLGRLMTLLTLVAALFTFHASVLAGTCTAGNGATCGGGPGECCKAGPNLCESYPCPPAM